MSYCLKTGGLLHDQSNGCVYECDLHVHGNCIIAVTCAPQFEFDPDDPRIMLIVAEGADIFYRDAKPYGMLVAEQIDCTATPALQKHIAEWYSGHRFGFRATAPA